MSAQKHIFAPEVEAKGEMEIRVVNDHVVETIRDLASDQIIHEEWDSYAGAGPDRSDGPAVIDIDPLTDVTTYQGWYRNGRLHNNNGPAAIWRDSNTGVAIREEWRTEGKYDRKNGGPASVWRDAVTGRVVIEEWWVDGIRNHITYRDADTGEITRDVRDHHEETRT